MGQYFFRRDSDDVSSSEEVFLPQKPTRLLLEKANVEMVANLLLVILMFLDSRYCGKTQY